MLVTLFTWTARCDVQVWKCESTDEATGQVTSSVDLSAVTQVNSAILTVAPMTLAHGLYRFTLRVELGSRHLFDVQQSTYVRITKSPIIARIVTNGMSEITRGANGLITLSPERYSIDPDLNSTAPQVTLCTAYFVVFKLRTKSVISSFTFSWKWRFRRDILTVR